MVEIGLIFTLILPFNDSIKVKIFVKLLASFLYDFSDYLLPLCVAALETITKGAVLHNVGSK